jgi:hypothetical protein
MGLLDRFVPKPAVRPTPPPASPKPQENAVPEPAPVPAAQDTALPATPALVSSNAPGGVLGRLKEAREAFAIKDRDGAVAIYEEVLAVAGDRADVLVTISGDLGVHGYAREIVELIAPHYDAKRHGPATGFNLLQAFIAIRDPEAAQHVLDLLFALNRPDLQERLLGFSNVIADMMLLGTEGMVAGEPQAGGAPGNGKARKIDMASISKPIWYYGLEEMNGLLPAKEGNLRRVAFGQLAVLGLEDVEETMKRPEEELGRLSRGIPLWLAETLCHSVNWMAITAVATVQKEHYGMFSAEWSSENIRQLVDSTDGAFDYVFTGTVRQKFSDYEMALNLWEVKKFRVRKSFTVRWTPATADQALADFHTQLRTFMEFKAYPAGQGLVYSLPANLLDYIGALGAGLTLFLVEKQVLSSAQAVIPAELAARLGAGATQSELASLLALSLHARARRLALPGFETLPALAATPTVDKARQVLAL